MPRRKNLPQINVSTVSNGYVLKIEKAKHEFLYFTPEKLLEGFMCHVGLNMTDQLTQQNISDFIDAAVNWRDNGKCVKEINRLKAELASMTQKRNGLARQLVLERKRYRSLYEDLKMIRDAAKPSFDKMLKDLSNTVLKRHTYHKELSLHGLGVTSNEIMDFEDEEVDDE